MSRTKEFRRRRRESWLRFLRTVGPFAVLAIIVAWLFLSIVPPTRAPIPVFYVGFDVSEDKNEIMHEDPKDRISRISGAKNLWGGIEQNSLLIFCDVVGSTGNTNEAGSPMIPEVFVPVDEAAHISSLFDEPAKGTWQPFFEYLNEITEELSKTVSADTPKYLIVALNVFHPDGPAGMPPQFNRFIQLVKDGWDDQVDVPANINLSLFLSHDFGQRNYQHSDPKQIGSHFKRTLDLYLQGKSAELSNINEITLGELTDPDTGLIRAVAASAARHELIQTPVLLRKGEHQQADVRLGSPEKDAEVEVGKYFVYRSRSETPNNVDKWWQQLQHKIEHRHWEVENPLELQRANMLLLQYERLWYSGREPEDDSELVSKLNQILGNRQTPEDPEHSLYEISRRMARTADPEFSPIASVPFDLKWLESEQEDGGRPRLDAWEKKVGSKYRRKVFEVWTALATTDLLNRDSLRKADELLSGSEFEFETPISELVFLRRLANELPRYDFGDTFMRAVRGAIKARDISNRLGSQLNPVLLSQFVGPFEDLENQRRVLDDRLFGWDMDNAAQLASDYSKLVERYETMFNQHAKELETLKEFNRQLLQSPHTFRFAVEVLSNQRDSKFDPNQIEFFDALWNSVSSNDATKVNTKEVDDHRVRMREVQKRLFPGAMDVYETTDIVVDNPAKVATDVRNISQRLLLFWPGEFSYGMDETSRKTGSGARQSVRQILNGSAVEEAGITSARVGSAEYQQLLTLARDGMIDSDGQLLLPMIRRINEKRKSRLVGLFGWPLLGTAAKETHLNWPVKTGAEDQKSASKMMIEAINQFHFLKSDFQFNRILGDFWGTMTSGKRYVDVALSEHNAIISKDILGLNIDMSAKKHWQRADPNVRGLHNETASNETTTETWADTRASLVASAEATFNNENYYFWKNKDEDSNSIYDELLLDPNVEPTFTFRNFTWLQYNEGNKFLISIRTPIQGDVNCTIANPRRSDSTQASWLYRKFDENRKRERDLYLRGWTIRKELPDYKIKGESSELVIASKPKQTETPLLKFSYGASTQQKTISFLIDCSASMEGDRWADVKQQIVDVLDRLLQRQDINVELFAFGATKKVKTVLDGGENVVVNLPNGNIDYLERTDLSKWTKNGMGGIPGIKYPGDGGDDWDVISYSGSNSLDELKVAIEELQPFGETPLFAALYRALRMSKSASNHFYVVMTDGVDFISSRKINGRVRGPDEPEYNWRKLTDSISELGRRKNIVEFNYADDAAYQRNGNNLKINKEKLKEFKRLVSESRIGDESLARFLDRLFPYPVLNSSYQGSKQLIDPSTLNFEKQVQKLRVSKFRDVVDKWDIKISSSGKFNLNRPATWNSNVPLSGNEYLEFHYSPDGQLDLIQPDAGFGPKVKIQNVEVEFRQEMGSSVYLEDFGIYGQTAFDFWSIDNQLTPSPVYSFISATSPTGRQMLLQDYNETASQIVSNLRQIVFPVLNRKLLGKLGFDENTSLALNLQETRNEFDWHILEFFDPGQRFKLFDRKNDLPLELLKEDDRTLDNISGNEDGDFKIQLRYDEISGYREYTFTVSRTDPTSDIPLDCWLIQVLDENGRRNSQVFRQTNNDPNPIKRIYKFDPDQKLERIQHKFAFEESLSNKFNDRRKGLFGLKRVDANSPPPGFTTITSGQFPDN